MALTLDVLAILHGQDDRQRSADRGDALLALVLVRSPSPLRSDCARGHYVFRKAVRVRRQPRSEANDPHEP